MYFSGLLTRPKRIFFSGLLLTPNPFVFFEPANKKKEGPEVRGSRRVGGAQVVCLNTGGEGNFSIVKLPPPPVEGAAAPAKGVTCGS